MTETITLRQEALASQLATVRDAIRQVESEIVQAIELNHDVLAILHSFTMEDAPSNAFTPSSLATQLEKSESDFKESVTYLLEAKNSCEEWTDINQLTTRTTWKINYSNGKQYRVNKLATDTQSSPDPSVILLNYALHRLKVANLWGEVTEDESNSDDDEGKLSIFNY